MTSDDKCRHGKPLNADCGLCDLGPDPREMRQLNTLSKSDFKNLGCEDVSGAQLRARVFDLEGLASELALTLEECKRLARWVGEPGVGSTIHRREFAKMSMTRIDEVLESAREKLK